MFILDTLFFSGSERGIPTKYSDTFLKWDGVPDANGFIRQFDGNVGTVGSVDINPNPTLNSEIFNGRVIDSYATIFFGYVKYSQDSYTFGVIPEDEIIEITFWNARTEKQGSVQVLSVQLPSDISLTVTEPSIAPYVFNAMEEIKYIVEASKEGQPSIQDSLIITYDIENLKNFEITGLRIITFKYFPNWDSEIEQTYSWKTDVLKSEDATEQRVKLNQNPKMIFKYTILINNADSKRLANALIAWGDKPFALPMWMDCCITDQVAGVGTSILYLQDTTGTSVEYSDLYYIPSIDKVFSVESKIIKDKTLSDSIVQVITPVNNQNITYDFEIPGISLIEVNVSGDLQNNFDFANVRNRDGTLIEAITGLNFSKNYILRDNFISVQIVTSATTISGDVTVTVRDRAQEADITVGSNFLTEIPIGTKVYPCLIGYIKNIDNLVNHTDTIKEIELTFVTNPIENFSSVVTIPQYKNLLVEENNPEWSEGLNQNINSSIYINDYGTGLLDVGLRNDFVGAIIERTEVLSDSRNIRQFKEELQTRSGRLNTFWLPTFLNDISIISTVLLGTTDLTVEEGNHTLLFDKSADYKHVRFQMTDGTIYYREITNVQLIGGNDNITIDSGFPVNYNSEDFKKISYMSFVRSNSDSVTLLWSTNEFVQISQSFEGILQ